MVRARRKSSSEPNGHRDTESGQSSSNRPAPIDVNAIVSYNLKVLRERRNWTQQYVAQKLSMLTGHVLPQASISSMERGFDGERRRRFDAHELYLFSIVFDVPITYFFLPPPNTGFDELADSGRQVAELYRSLLGTDAQLVEMDERLEGIKVSNPDQADRILALIYGADKSLRNWHEHYRTWRKKRLVALSKEYGDELDDVAARLAKFAEAIAVLGPKGYLQSMAHKDGESVHLDPLPRPEDVTDDEVREALAKHRPKMADEEV